MNTELRPMGIGDILDTTFRLYRQRFLTFLTIALIVYVPYAALLAVVQGSQTPGLAGRDANLGLVVLQGIIQLVFVLVLVPLCTAAMVQCISTSYLGESLSAAESYSRAAPRLLGLLGSQILAGLIIIVGFILLIVPGVIFSLWFYVLPPIVVLEGIAGSEALGRSRELIRGNLGKTFLLALVVGLLCGVINFVLGLAVGLLLFWQPALVTFGSIAVSAITLPIQMAPIILYYYDLRIRKEAFDLQKLSEVLGQPVAQ